MVKPNDHDSPNYFHNNTSSPQSFYQNDVRRSVVCHVRQKSKLLCYWEKDRKKEGVKHLIIFIDESQPPQNKLNLYPPYRTKRFNCGPSDRTNWPISTNRRGLIDPFRIPRSGGHKSTVCNTSKNVPTCDLEWRRRAVSPMKEIILPILSLCFSNILNVSTAAQRKKRRSGVSNDIERDAPCWCRTP